MAQFRKVYRDGISGVEKKYVKPDGSTVWQPTVPYYITDKDTVTETPAFRSHVARRTTAEDTSAGEAFGVSAGREISKFREGVTDLKDMVMGNDQARQDRAESEQSKDDTFDYLKREHPIATTLGPVVPYLAGGAGSLLMAGGKKVASKFVKDKIKEKTQDVIPNFGGLQSLKDTVKAVGAEGAKGALAGAAHYGDTALSGLATGVGGGLLGRWLGNALGGTKGRLTSEEERIMANAKKYGLHVPPGMKTGDPRLQQLDSAMKSHSSTSLAVDDMMANSKLKENEAISKELGGRQVNLLTDDFLDETTDRIGSKLDELTLGKQSDFIEDDFDEIADIIDSYANLSSNQKAPPLLTKYEDLVGNLLDEDRGEFTGEQYNAWTKELMDASRAQNKDNPALAGKLQDISNVFHNAMDEGVSDTSGALKEARRQYALAMSIKQAKTKTNTKGFIGESGYVDTSKLQKLHSSNKTINELAEIEKLRKSQPGASLSTSGLLGRMLSEFGAKPSDSMGTAALLSSRLLKGTGPLQNIPVWMYQKGYPHATGVAPIFGRNTEDIIEELTGAGSRSASADVPETEESIKADTERRIQMLNKMFGGGISPP